MERLKLKHLSAIAAGLPLLGFGSSAWAQATSSCAFSLSYAPVIAPGTTLAVPSLTFAGVAASGLLIELPMASAYEYNPLYMPNFLLLHQRKE